MKKVLLSVALAVLSLSMFAQTKVGDATLPNKLNIESDQLVLNGSGLREKLWFDLYACGLYLQSKSNQASTIVNADKPMTIHMEILSSLLSKKKLIGAFKDGIKKTNSTETVNKIAVDLKKFLSFVDSDIKVGDKYSLVYTPNAGTSLYINNKKKGTIQGLDFKSAIFNMWLSETPADKSLRKELLGIK